MRKIGDALRLCAGALPPRRIGQSLGVGRTTAGEYLRRARRAGRGWPLPDDLTDPEPERRLFRLPGGEAGVARTRPDWPAIHRELRRTGVTLSLPWAEYRAVHPAPAMAAAGPDGLCRRWEGRLTPVMRPHHGAPRRE